MSTGLPLLVALVEFGVIVWLWLSRRDARRQITNLTLRARRAELRAVPDTEEHLLSAVSHMQAWAHSLLHPKEEPE